MPDQVNPTNQINPVNTTPQTKKPLNWKLIGIISVVAAILIGGAGYAAVVLNVFDTKEEPAPTTTTTKTATPSATKTTPKEEPKDETENWKTYSNSQGKYSLKQPSELKGYDLRPGVTYDPTTSTDLVITDKDLSPYQPGAGKENLEPQFELIKIDISGIPDDKSSSYYGLSFPEIAKKLWETNKDSYLKPKSITDLKSETFASKSAFSFTETRASSYSGVGGSYLFGGNFDSLKIIVVKIESNIIQIIYKPTETTEKVLSTFKFL